MSDKKALKRERFKSPLNSSEEGNNTQTPGTHNSSILSFTQDEMASDITWGDSPGQEYDTIELGDYSFDLHAGKRVKPNHVETQKRSNYDAFSALVNSVKDSASKGIASSGAKHTNTNSRSENYSSKVNSGNEMSQTQQGVKSAQLWPKSPLMQSTDGYHQSRNSISMSSNTESSSAFKGDSLGHSNSKDNINIRRSELVACDSISSYSNSDTASSHSTKISTSCNGNGKMRVTANDSLSTSKVSIKSTSVPPRYPTTKQISSSHVVQSAEVASGRDTKTDVIELSVSSTNVPKNGASSPSLGSYDDEFTESEEQMWNNLFIMTQKKMSEKDMQYTERSISSTSSQPGLADSIVQPLHHNTDENVSVVKKNESSEDEWDESEITRILQDANSTVNNSNKLVREKETIPSSGVLINNNASINITLNAGHGSKVADSSDDEWASVEAMQDIELILKSVDNSRSNKITNPINTNKIQATRNVSNGDSDDWDDDAAIALLQQVESAYTAGKTEVGGQRSSGIDVNSNIRKSQMMSSNRFECIRLIAIDATDQCIQGKYRKEIRCFYPNAVLKSRMHSNDVESSEDKTVIVHLYDDWCNSEINGGDLFHICNFCCDDISYNYLYQSCNDGNPNMSTNRINLHTSTQYSTNSINHSYSNNIISLNNSNGLLIIHPDILITPSKIADSLSCMRKAVLVNQIKSLDNGTAGIAATLGNLKHDFIEKMIKYCLKVKLNNEVESRSTPLEQQTKTPPLSLPTSQTICPSNHPIESLAGCVNEKVNRSVPLEYRQYSLTSQIVDNMITDTIGCHADVLSSCNISDASAKLELHSIVSSVLQWINFMTDSKRISAPQPPLSGTYFNGQSNNATLSPMRWVDVVGQEELIWCPSLGLKGQMDLLLDSEISLSSASDETSSVRISLPVELKTGKWRPTGLIGHRAQIILYIIMNLLREYNVSSQLAVVPWGMLLYIGGNAFETKWELLSPQWNEIRSLIQIRNNLASSIKSSSNEVSHSKLPPMLRNYGTCEWCYQASECMVSHKIIDRGEANSSGVKNIFDYVLRKMNVNHLKYLQHWLRLIDLEYNATLKYGEHVIWMGASKEKSRCIDKLQYEGLSLVTSERGDSQILPDYDDDTSTTDNSKGYIIKLKRFNMSEENLSGLMNSAENCDIDDDETDQRPNISSVFVTGDNIVLSVRTSKINRKSKNNLCSTDIEDLISPKSHNILHFEPHLCNGKILTVSNELVTIQVLKLPTRVKRFFKNIPQLSKCKTFEFVIDKEEFSHSVFPILRSNLIRLFANSFDPVTYKNYLKQRVLADLNNEDSETNVISEKNNNNVIDRIRSLIVDLQPPTFKSNNMMHHDDNIMIFCPDNVTSLTYRNVIATLMHLRANSMSSSMKYGQILPYQVDKTSGIISVFGGINVYPGCNPLDLVNEYQSMNEGQQNAVRSALSANDYSLLLGMPGSGKTTTVAFIVRVLIAKGLKVLVTSYTHNAVDSLMSKVLDAGLPIEIMLRIGSESSVDSSLLSILHLDSHMNSTVSNLESSLAKMRLWACTALTIARHPLANKMDFDWCIIDEAGQISQPAAIGPLILAKKFLLVGDDYQLPPLIASHDAKTEGMEVSMFKRLSEAHPVAVVYLSAQYRMNADIMMLSNSLIYSNRLHCGSRDVYSNRLRNSTLSDDDGIQIIQLLFKLSNVNDYSVINNDVALIKQNINCCAWLQKCVDPSQAVVFLNTDSCRYKTSELYDNVTDTTVRNGMSALDNKIEALIVRAIVSAFQMTGVDIINDIGIISPFRLQVKQIRSLLLDVCSNASNLQCPYDITALVNTVDKFQGRDKNIIIFSTVRSKSNSDEVGDLLRDWRRINVALSRAKCKLIVIGSSEIMQQVPILRDFTQIINQKDWTVTFDV